MRISAPFLGSSAANRDTKGSEAMVVVAGAMAGEAGLGLGSEMELDIRRKGG